MARQHGKRYIYFVFTPLSTSPSPSPSPSPPIFLVMFGIWLLGCRLVYLVMHIRTQMFRSQCISLEQNAMRFRQFTCVLWKRLVRLNHIFFMSSWVRRKTVCFNHFNTMFDKTLSKLHSKNAPNAVDVTTSTVSMGAYVRWSERRETMTWKERKRE